LPTFSPSKRPRKASGAFSRPSVTVSRYWMSPLSTHSASCLVAASKRGWKSLTRKPRTVARVSMSRVSFRGPVGSDWALYRAICPQTATRASTFSCVKTASVISPPTLSK
jgi:hypothetical protein